MIGAAVVLVLAGLMVPILLLLGAIVVDFFVVSWVLFHTWHDDRSPRRPGVATGTASRARALQH
jgi:hypothetical protein